MIALPQCWNEELKHRPASLVSAQMVHAPRKYPHYPMQALTKRVAGRVVLLGEMDAEGKWTHVQVVGENPVGWGFAEAAIPSFKTRKMIPDFVEGVPTNTWVEEPIAFDIAGR